MGAWGAYSSALLFASTIALPISMWALQAGELHASGLGMPFHRFSNLEESRVRTTGQRQCLQHDYEPDLGFTW
jgi:hypothetical protein